MKDNQKNEKKIIPLRKPIIEFNRIISYIKKLLTKKYFVSKTLYEKYIVKNLIYDERNKLVSTFKEHLIMNDTSEFMKRYYTYQESIIRLNKYFDFYTNYSKLFPNYIPLLESKYIYKNIHKKQKIIDIQHNYPFRQKDYSKTRNNRSKIFSSDIYGSIAKNTENVNSIIFGIKKDEKNINSSSSKILNIINSIDKYELEPEHEYQHQNNNNENFRLFNKYNKDLKDKNIIINNYYYNNSSILTKQSTIPSMLTQQKKNNTNEKVFSIISSNILIGLKKTKKKIGIKNGINNSTTFKNLISYGLVNNIDDKSINIKKSKYFPEDTYSFGNSSKNNKSINYISNISNNNINNSNIFKKNIQNYTKCMPYTSRIYPSQNQKLIDAMNKLIGNFNNNNYKIHPNNNKSSINSPSRSINKKKINFLLTKRLFHNKTNCLSDRSSHCYEKINNIHKKKQFKFSTNKKLKKNSKNKRNNSDNNKSKNYIKIINKNIFYKKIKKYNIETGIQKKINSLCKKQKVKHPTSKFLNTHINTISLHSNNLNIQKPVVTKIKLDNSNIKTERENTHNKNLNEFIINQNIKIKHFLNEKIKKIRKTNSNIKYINNFKNLNKLNKNNKNIIKLFNDNDYFTNSFFKSKGNLTIRRNIKSNHKNNKKIKKNKIKQKLFINHEINKELLFHNKFYSTENSINYSSNNETIKKELNSDKRIKKAIKHINLYNQNDNNTFYDIDINKNFNLCDKKASAIKIKGIQIKNFNKILNVNKEKSKSNSSQKSRRLNITNNKFFFKIPKDINFSKKINVDKIKDNNKKINNLKQIINTKMKTTNYNNNIFFPKSLTERNNLNKF